MHRRLFVISAAVVGVAGLFVAVGREAPRDLDAYAEYVWGASWPHLQERTVEGVRFSARYLSTEAVMLPHFRLHEERLRRLEADAATTVEQGAAALEQARRELDEQRALYDGSLYFALTVTPEEEGQDLIYGRMEAGFGAYSAWLNRLLFALEEKVVLRTASGDELPLSGYTMERTFGTTPGRTFLLTFPSELDGRALRGGDPLQLHIEEFGLHTGSVTFDFALPRREASLLLTDL